MASAKLSLASSFPDLSAKLQAFLGITLVVIPLIADWLIALWFLTMSWGTNCAHYDLIKLRPLFRDSFEVNL